MFNPSMKYSMRVMLSVILALLDKILNSRQQFHFLDKAVGGLLKHLLLYLQLQRPCICFQEIHCMTQKSVGLK